MPPLNMLIKPASGRCNMRCSYCFYNDISETRQIRSYGLMSYDTLNIIVKKAFDYADNVCMFAFQGGEPTLASIEFFRELISYVKEHNRKNIDVQFSIQTNGLLIDDEWSEFFYENKFLVGISLDGIKETHDAYRKSASGDGTFKAVMKSIEILKRHDVSYNILTVLNNITARNISKIYGFYKRNNFEYQQYIPCLDSLRDIHVESAPSLSVKRYEHYLKTLFDLWYLDSVNGRPTYNRYFDNIMRMLAGYDPECCGMLGHCSMQYVIEADGGVYPCDFYVIDQYRLGDINSDDFCSLHQKFTASSFFKRSLSIPEACKHCKWFKLCRGGCGRDREFREDELGVNRFCEAYKAFFCYAVEKMYRLPSLVRKS